MAIPVKAFGVVQFGSRKKVLETRDFLDQAQSLLKVIDEIELVKDSENAVLSMDFTDDDINGLLASFSSENSCDWNLKSANDENYKDLRQVFSPCEERNTSLEFEENSCFDSLLQQFLSETMAQEVHDSSLASLQNIDEVSIQEKIQNSTDNVVTEVDLPSSSSILNGISNSLEPVDMLEEFLKFGSVDDLCKWFAPSPDETTICNTMIQLEKTLSEPIEFNPICSDLGLAEKETSVVIHSSESDFLDNTEFDLGSDQGSELWGNLLTPMVNVGTDNTAFSECISELNTDTPTDNTRKRLFAELGIEELLRGEANYSNPFSSSNFENAILSNKKQMLEFSPTSITQVHYANLTGSNLMHPVSDLEQSNSVLTKKDTFSKLQVGISVNDRNSINVKRAVPAHTKRPEQPAKHIKKKAKPGESTRRPKDRQLIQDCIKELRGIVPHGGKVNKASIHKHVMLNFQFAPCHI